MDKADLAALLDAHGGRAQQVASLHVLRAAALGADEQAFLTEHRDELATIDLSRWLGLAAPDQRPAVLDALAALAERDPARFEAEIARAPHFTLAAEERLALAGRLGGRVPASVLEALSGVPSGAGGADGGPSPAATDALAGGGDGGGMFDPGDLLDGVDFGTDDGLASNGARGGGAFGGGVTGGGLSGGGAQGLADDGLGDLLGDADLFDSPGGGPADGDGAPSPGGDLFGGGAPPPLLAALLADLVDVNTTRARTAWRARARALAADPAEDWSRAVTRLPKEMADAVAARAASSPRADERATLLEWLLQNGARRAKIVELAVALLGAEPKVESVSQWLSQSLLPRLLSDKAAWSKHGAEVLGALAGARAFGEMDQLFTAAVTGGGALGPGLLALPGGDGALRGPVFSALSTMLIDGTSAALASGEDRGAQAFAAALASIGFPSRKAKAVASLRRKRAAKGDVARLLGVAPARKPRDVPRLEDFIAAAHVLSDAI